MKDIMQINNKAKIRVCFVFQPAAVSTTVESFKTSEGILQVLFFDHASRKTVSCYYMLR